MRTRKQIQKEFPRFEIIREGNFGYSVRFIPWNAMNCCILRGMNLDGIYRFVKAQNEYFEEHNTFSRSYFRKEIQ